MFICHINWKTKSELGRGRGNSFVGKFNRGVKNSNQGWRDSVGKVYTLHEWNLIYSLMPHGLCAILEDTEQFWVWP